MDYNSLMLTLIFASLLMIALPLLVISSTIRLFAGLLRSPQRHLKALEKDKMPWIIKMVAVKIVGHMAIRYVGKKMR